MDAILSFILEETAQNLKVDRALILRLKYQNPLKNKNDIQENPQIKVELFLDWIKEKGIIKNPDLYHYELAKSPLILHAWKTAPKLISISSEKKLNELLSTLDNHSLFPFENQHIKSLLILPLFGNYNNSENEPINLGFLVFFSHKSHQWTTKQIEMTKSVALQTSLSIIHQQTFTKVQSLVDERTAQLKMSLDVQAKLSEKMRHHIEELRRLNNIKDQFIANMSDALKNPLTNMRMGIKMLKLMGDTQHNQRYLEILEAECEKEISLVNNLLTLQELEAHKFLVNSQKLRVKDIFEEYKSYFEQEWQHKQLNFVFNLNLDFIDTDLNSFQLVIKELLQNASKFSYPNSEVIVNAYTENDVSIFEFINTSAKISELEQEKIFDAFYQNQDYAHISNNGTGLGLALVKSLIENLHGTIKVSNTLCENNRDYLTTFTIHLPHLSS